MKYATRAALAVLLIIGFYVVCLALAGGMIALAVAAAKASVSGPILAKIWIVALIAVLAIGRGIFKRTRTEHEAPGMELTPLEHPTLWAEVRELAEAAGTRPPDEIRLVPEVNAAVSEETRLLGLVGGTRRLYLGVPLMQGMTRLQLRSVLAHELGHYSGRHTALGAVAYRGRESIGRVVDNLGQDSWLAIPLRWYERLYVAVSHSTNRRQELEADELSARLAGSEVAVGALSRLPALASGWGFFLHQYVGGLSHAGRPSDLLAGFQSFLHDPERRQQMADWPIEEGRASAYDTHPSLADRIAALEALALPGEADTSGPAVELLTDPDETVDAFTAFLFRDAPGPSLPFSELVALAAGELAQQNARQLAAALPDGSERSLEGALALLRDGRAEELLGLAQGDDAQRREVLGGLLGQAVAGALVRHGRAGFRLSWAGPAELVDDQGVELDPWTLAEEALESSAGLARLEAWLRTYGVHTREVLEAPAPVEEELAPDQLLAACAAVGGSARILAVLGAGVVLKKPDAGDRWTAAKHTYGDTDKALLRRTLEAGSAALLTSPKATLLRWEDITGAVYRGKRLDRGVLTLTSGGTSYTVKFLLGTEKAGDPLAVIEHLLGARFRTD